MTFLSDHPYKKKETFFIQGVAIFANISETVVTARAAGLPLWTATMCDRPLIYRESPYLWAVVSCRSSVSLKLAKIAMPLLKKLPKFLKNFDKYNYFF